MLNCVVLLLEEEQANSNFWEVRGQSRRSVFSESCWRNSALKDSISVFTHREPRVPSKCPGGSRWPLYRASLGSLYHWLEGFNRSSWFRFPEISVPSWFYCIHLLSVLHKYAFASTTTLFFCHPFSVWTCQKPRHGQRQLNATSRNKIISVFSHWQFSMLTFFLSLDASWFQSNLHSSTYRILTRQCPKFGNEERRNFPFL